MKRLMILISVVTMAACGATTNSPVGTESNPSQAVLFGSGAIDVNGANPCELNLCHNGGVCSAAADGMTVQCDCAGTGYEGATCEQDTDECAFTAASPCGANGICRNTKGAYECACKQGYEGDGVTCTDVDECVLEPCGANASCTNTEASYACTCDKGYAGDGINCVDVNECLGKISPCDGNAICANNVGGYTCTCNAGWEGDGASCADVDECSLEPAPCVENATCTNIDGSYTCACSDGYEGDGILCVDVDECSFTKVVASYDFDDIETGLEGWIHSSEMEFNPPSSITSVAGGMLHMESGGGFIISPPVMDTSTGGKITLDFMAGDPSQSVGFFWYTCDDPEGSDECMAAVLAQDVSSTNVGPLEYWYLAENPPEGEVVFELPQSTPGFLMLVSLPGATGASWTIDNLEFIVGDTPCDVKSTCTNTEGAYSCTCDDGWEGDGWVCDDVDECEMDNAGCEHICTNTDESFECSCEEGFALTPDGYTCEEGTYLGSFEVRDGPPSGNVSHPPVYSCLEACAIVFGGEAGEYACSTSADMIDHMAYYDSWSDGAACVENKPHPEDFKKGDIYKCTKPAGAPWDWKPANDCAMSAYVKNHNCKLQNHCYSLSP